MRSAVTIFIVGLLTAFLFSCAYPEYKDRFQPHPDVQGKAKLYLYRSNTKIHAGNPDVPRFYIGDKVVGRLMIGGYFVEMLEPGKIEMFTKTPLFGIFFPWRSKMLEFVAEPNKTYYAKFEVDMFGGASLKLVSALKGEAEIKDTQLLVNE